MAVESPMAALNMVTVSSDERCTPFLPLSKYKIVTAVTIVTLIVGTISVQQWQLRYVVDVEAKSMLWKQYTLYAKKEKSSVKGTRNCAVQKYLSLKDKLEERLKTATEKKIILIWVPMFGVKSKYIVDPEKCGSCEVTHDRFKINENATGAVIFHFDGIQPNDMPSNRNLRQLYIFWNMESAATLRFLRGRDLRFEDSFNFNGTMTYRLDSDFYTSYDFLDSISHIVESMDISLEKLLREKTKAAVAVVSNCGYTNGAKTRIRMLKELQNLRLRIDGFGNCFSGVRKIANGKHCQSQEFHDEIRKYKFYFSFENSYHCKDYITEKFFNNAVASLAVPVVWGTKKEDYEAVAPPGSFIHADDFSSMKDLADYLNYLDKNDSAYLEYLRWITMKPTEMPQYGRTTGFCQICRALHGINIDDIYSPKFNESSLERPLFTDGVAPRTVNLIDTFYGEDYPECFNR